MTTSQFRSYLSILLIVTKLTQLICSKCFGEDNRNYVYVTIDKFEETFAAFDIIVTPVQMALVLSV